MTIKILKRTILIIFFIFLTSFINECKNLNFSYIKYLIIEEDSDKSKIITIYDELYQIDGNDFIRVGYSITQKLFIQYRENKEGVFWMAFNNFRQDLHVRSIFDLYNIPRNENEAINKGYQLIKESDYKREYAYEDKKNQIEISFLISGDIEINRLKKKLSRNRTLIFYPIKQKLFFEKIKESKLKEIYELKEKAKRGEKKLSKFTMNFFTSYKKYKLIVLGRIKEILNHYSKYYLGIVDYGIAVFAYENNFKRSEDLLNNAIILNKHRGEAYGYLSFIYIVKNIQNKLEKIREDCKKNLSEKEEFKSDQIVLLLLSFSGEKKEAKKLFDEMKSKYIAEDFKIQLKYLKTLIY